MFSLDTSKIAETLIAAFIGGWFSWVTFGLLKAKSDLNGAHRNIRKLANGRSNFTKSGLCDPMETSDSEDVRTDF